MVYNIIRQLPKERGFEPCGKGYEDALNKFNFYVKFNKFDELLFPFEEKLAIEEFKELL